MAGDSPVVVIGAGPAGATAARLLATWGHDVVVLARRTPSDRSLGESIPPSCVALLERVGVTGLERAGFLRSTGNTVRWGEDAERVGHFADGAHGYQVERATFDDFLVRQAVVAGADVRLGANVTSVRREADSSAVTFEIDARVQTMAARWVLDCTGRVGVIARDTWRQPESGGRTTAIIGVWEREKAWPTADPSHTIVESVADAWAWSVPVSAVRRYVALMLDPTVARVANREGLEGAYVEQLARTRTFGALTRGARRVGPVFARDASPYGARAYGDPGLLLVGDAGSFVDPLSSYGVKKAVASAWLASVAVHSILLDSAIAGPALELFNARERAMYETLKQSAAALARDAASARSTAFWEARSLTIDESANPEPDVVALRSDGDVLRSLEELRTRDRLQLRHVATVHRSRRPTVRGNRVVLEEHLIVPAFPHGIRYVRNIDLVRLSDLAVRHDQVPELFEAYNRASSPAPLPDFLGALSVLIGKRVLEWTVA